MTTSDRLSLCALAISILSILMVPVAAWLSHRSAVTVFRLEQEESKVDQLYQAKCRLDHDLTLYGRLVRTIGETDLGADFNTHPIPDPDAFFEKVFDTGIYDLVLSDVSRLQELGFDLFLKIHDSEAHDAFIVFCLSQKETESAKKAELIGRCFLEKGVQDRLGAITRGDIRKFLSST